MREPSSMATQSLRPPHFSEDVAWLPCWLQSLGTNGSIEFVKESQAPSIQEAKEEKVLAASICLEGKALNWFQW
ncbi:hypothetical protein CR513_39460, partial [Mucuna pruriens]